MSEAMIFKRDVAIPVRDGTVLLANVYRPSSPGQYPVIMTVGPYGKDVPFAIRNPEAYALIAEHGSHLNWETPNPEWWVPEGYVIVRVDQRGVGASPGRLDLFSQQQGEDFYDAIEWAAIQLWSTEKWDCSEFPTMQSLSGRSPHCSHLTWKPSFPGKDW